MTAPNVWEREEVVLHNAPESQIRWFSKDCERAAAQARHDSMPIRDYMTWPSHANAVLVFYAESVTQRSPGLIGAAGLRWKMARADYARRGLSSLVLKPQRSPRTPRNTSVSAFSAISAVN